MLAMATQVYHGDGASPGVVSAVSGTVLQWQLPLASTSSDKCLSCHQSGASGTDKSSYLMTGHKNMVRKVYGTSPLNIPWAKADGTPYGTSYATMVPPGMWTDPGNLSATFDWSTGTVTYSPWLGTVLGTPSTAPLFYIVDAWMDPTEMNSIFSGGFTGELPGDYGVNFPAGNYMCGRCHMTGYQFDNSGPQPTDYLGNPIPDSVFSRIPADFIAMPGPVGAGSCTDPTSATGLPGSGTHCTSSWYLDGIQCERCHNADNGINNHTATGAIAGGIPTKPTNTAATAACLECHRQEYTDTVNNLITLSTILQISGAMPPCSDGVSLDQATCAASTACTGSAGGCTWTYWGPATALDGAGLFFDTNPGQTFLNSPHARFTGTLVQNAQNSSDLSVVVTGTYNSKFQQNGSQGGCTTCHDVHQSVVPAGAAMPITNKCTTCHTESLSSIKHPSGSGTPLNVTDPADACVICHMPSGTTGIYHLMRINVDPSYSTFPTPAQYYNSVNPQTFPNTASDGSFTSAVWNDLDLTCGQCHGGSNTTMPQVGIPLFDKVTLAGYAACIHSDSASTVNSVTAGADANGSISPSGIITVNSGGSQTFTITPSAGYQVQSVIVDGSNRGAVTNYTISNISGCHSIMAFFKMVSYTITATAGLGGSISPGTSYVNSGGDITFTITPSTGYTTAGVSVDGVPQGSVGTVPFMNVTSNHTISATFTPNPSYTINASAGPNGTISPTGGVSVLGGTNQTFTITPAAGYVVANVLVDGASVGAVTSYTFSNIQAGHTISASFMLNVYTITAAADVNGSIGPSGAQTVNPGGSITFTITPNPGYVVSSVLVDGSQMGAVTSYTFTNVIANHTINAYFKVATFTLTASATSGGSISPGTIIVNYGVNQTYTITPAAGYTTSDVKVDGGSVGAVTSYTFNNVTANHTIAATFAANSSWTINASSDSNGTISPTGSVSVLNGAYQKFTFTPNAGYRVADVQVDGKSVGARTSYTFNSVTANHTIYASFTLDNYTITATADVNGSITPSGTITVNHGATQAFTITPNGGFTVRSVIVDGANRGAVTSFTFTNVSANHTINAYFK